MLHSVSMAVTYTLFAIAFALSLFCHGCAGAQPAPVAPPVPVSPAEYEARRQLCIGSMLAVPKLDAVALQFGKTVMQLAEDVCGYAVPGIEAAAKAIAAGAGK